MYCSSCQLFSLQASPRVPHLFVFYTPNLSKVVLKPFAMYIPTVEPTATISQTTSIVTIIATSTSTTISAPSSDQPDIVKLCSGQIFCVIYLSAGPWDASNIIAFFKDFAQAILLACVSIVLVL
jgi:hypothetical protein